MESSQIFPMANTSQKTFNDLDEYSKLKIFKYLDVKSLLQCTEALKSWNELIGQKASLMQNINLHIKNRVDDDIFRNSDRSYQNMTLTKVLIDEQALQNLKNILGNVKNLQLKETITFSSYGTFVDFMQCLSAAQTVIIDEIKIIKNSNLSPNPTKKGSDIKLNFELLRIGKTPVGQEDDTPEDFQVIEFLLSHQHNLKYLAIDLPSYRPDLNSQTFVKIVKILCDNYDKLKTVQSFTTRLRTFNYRTDFIDFLKCFGSSLRMLSIKPDSDALGTLSPYLMTTIQNHTTLTDLTLSLDEELCDVEEWIENRKSPPAIECSAVTSNSKNVHLTTLKLDKIMLTNSGHFFRGFPNISDLHLDLCDSAPRPVEFARNARSHLKSLKNLRLPSGSEEVEVEQQI